MLIEIFQRLFAVSEFQSGKFQTFRHPEAAGVAVAAFVTILSLRAPERLAHRGLIKVAIEAHRFEICAHNSPPQNADLLTPSGTLP
jgi:hypothetical protein